MTDTARTLIEADLIEQCLPEITGEGDRVYSEVEVIDGHIDVVIVRVSGERHAFEFKLKGVGACIIQAAKRKRWVDKTHAVLPFPKTATVREQAIKTAEGVGVGLFWYRDGQIDVAVDALGRRPHPGDEAAMTDQLKQAEQMGQQAGTRSPRQLTEYEQIVIEAEKLVIEQGPQMVRELACQLAPDFGRDTKWTRNMLTKRIKEGKGRSLSLEMRGGVNVVVSEEIG